MLSFLVDTSALLGPGGSAPLAQCNQPPIAVNDPLTVERTAASVTVNVLANDIDPEGQSLTLVSATASFGIAVVEVDNTVTYVPPGVPVEFDIVVYEIADADGARDTGQIDITITDPTVSVTTLPGNTPEVSAGAGPIDITITDPPEFVGTYSVDLTDLAEGPATLVAPGVTGTVAAGETLTATAGLWVYDTGAGTPVRGWQWQRGGVDIPGAIAAITPCKAPISGQACARWRP